MDLLPGLWVGLLGALLASALRRWFDPVPRRILAVFAVVLAVLLGPALFGGGLLLPFDGLRGAVPFQRPPPHDPPANLVQGDLLQLVTPSLDAVRDAWADGRWPLWNRRAGAGMPLLADPQAQALQPLALLAYPLPLYRAAGVTAALRILLALVFGFLWMRRQGLGEAPALAGALALGSAASSSSGSAGRSRARRRSSPSSSTPWPVATRREDAATFSSSPWRPGSSSSAATRRRSPTRSPRRSSSSLDRLRRRPRSERFALARRAAAALAVAVLAAAPVLLPAADLPAEDAAGGAMRQARRGHPYATDAVAKSYLPFVTPNAFGNSRFGEAWGLENTNEEAGGFVGTAMLLAALLALPVWRAGPASRRSGWRSRS